MTKNEELSAKIAELERVITGKDAQIHALQNELKSYDHHEGQVVRIADICRVQLRDESLDGFTRELLETIRDIAIAKPRARTNGDAFRAKSDEELAAFFCVHSMCNCDAESGRCGEDIQLCKRNWLAYLAKPATAADGQ